MEGYVEWYKRGRYQRYWTVLDGQQLSFYEKLDLQLQEAINIQGVYFIQNATITKLSYQSKEYCISIKCEGKKSTEYINCGSSNQQSDWYKALERGCKLQEEEKSRLQAPFQYRAILGIPPDVKLSRNYIVKVFRKLSLKAHPDKGGDPEKFTEIRHAYTSLLAIQNEEDEKKNSIEIEYEAVIEKAEGVGLGIVVLEDPIRRRIVVQTVQKNIFLKGLSEESEGEIRPGDCLSTIENDNCRNWPLSRIRARLNTHRVPAGAIVRLTLSRRIVQPQENDPNSPPTSPTESERGLKDQSLISPAPIPAATLSLNTESGIDEYIPPPPGNSPPSPILTPSPLRNTRSWTSDEESSSFTPAERTPKSSPRPKKRLSVSPLPSPEFQIPHRSQPFASHMSPHGSSVAESDAKILHDEEKSSYLSRNSDSEINDSYETNDSESDEKTIPRTSIGESDRPMPQATYRSVQSKRPAPTLAKPQNSVAKMETQLTAHSIQQIITEISFTSLSQSLNRDSQESQVMITQWEQELSRLEEDDDDSEINLPNMKTSTYADLEAELLKTKSDLLSSHTVRTQMASHIDHLTSEVNELKERSLALTKLVQAKSLEDLEHKEEYSDLMKSIAEMTSLRQNQQQLLNSLSISKFLLQGKIQEISHELELLKMNDSQVLQDQENTSHLLNDLKGSEQRYSQGKQCFQQIEERIKEIISQSTM